MTITVTVAGGNTFLRCTGSGTESYTNSDNPASVTMNDTITETGLKAFFCDRALHPDESFLLS